MQTVGIADQNGGENVVNASRLRKWRACFSYKCSQGGKNKLKVTPDAVSIKQLKMIFKLNQILACLPLLLIPKGTSQFFVQFIPVVSSRFVYFVISFQNMSCSLLPNCLLFNLLHSHHFQIWNIAYSTDLCTSSTIIPCSLRGKKRYLPALPTISSKRSKQY